MHKRLKAAVAPTVVAAAITWAGIARAQGPDPRSERFDELGVARPAAASHRHVDGVLVAASQAVEEERWIEGAQQRQLELFYEGILAAEAEKAPASTQGKPVAPTGRGGDGGGTVGGPCGGATNGADAFIARESGGNPNARNASGAWGCYQIMPGTWSSNCSDLGQHGSASTEAQAACASRLPQSSWGGR